MSWLGTVLLAAAAAGCVGLLDVLVQHLAVSANGSQGPLWGSMFLMVSIFLGALAAVPVGIALILARRTRVAGVKLVAAGAVGIAVLMALGNLSQAVRMRGFARLAERSAVLVSAIERYEQEQGRPPVALADLVPGYLATVPGTGIGAYPDYDYSMGERAQGTYGDRWALSVFTPAGGISFDQFYYVPSRAYPEYGLGGFIERVGDWAYVHE